MPYPATFRYALFRYTNRGQLISVFNHQGKGGDLTAKNIHLAARVQQLTLRWNKLKEDNQVVIEDCDSAFAVTALLTRTRM